MQKKIIALAVAGLMSGAAFAQSNVTIYGDLDIGYLNSKTDANATVAGVTASTTTKASSTGFNTGAVGTNKIGFMGVEDLGGGLKADFKFEFGPNENTMFGADSGTETNALGALAIRKQVLGLSGGFGRFSIGRDDVAIESVWSIGLAGMKNNAVGDIYTSKFNDTRADELMTYSTPNFSGLTAAVQFGKGKTDTTLVATDASHKQTGLTLAYANGPMAVGLGYNRESGDAAGAETVDRKSWILAGNYNFGVAKVFGLYFDGSNDVNTNTSDIDGWELGVHVPVTAQITLFGSYFDTDLDTNTAGIKATGDGTGYQLGALYSLSKRTTVYAAYGNEKADVKVDDLNKGDAKTRQFAIGLKHSF